MTLITKLTYATCYCFAILAWVYATLRTFGAFALGNPAGGVFGVLVMGVATVTVYKLKQQMQLEERGE